MTISAGQSAEFIANGLPPDTLGVEVRVDQAQFNTLASDDVAYAVNTTNNTRNALLLTNGNRFLEQSLAALPGLRVTRSITPPLGTQRFDLYVLDRLTMTLPARANVLAIAATPLIGIAPVISTSGAFSETQFVRSDSHPVMDKVDWRSVNILDAQRVNVPGWLRPLVQARGGALLYAGESIGEVDPSRMVLLPFELRRSDLPLQIAFPIMIANSVDWLAPPQGINAPSSVRPGEVVPIPDGATVTLPDGAQVSTDKRGFVQTSALGVYQFTAGAEGARTRGAFAVNFLNPGESAIAPSGELALGAQSAGDAANAAAQQGLSQREFWNWMAALALALLVIEWWIYQRGVPVLQKRKA